MKRLTVKTGVYQDDGHREVAGMKCGVELKDIFDRLAAIEDILGDEYDLDRLRELVEADREQRCFVFMFGFGSTVYRTWIHPSGSPTFITENKMDTLNDLLNAETWDNAYSTRAEAEEALRREQKEDET